MARPQPPLPWLAPAEAFPDTAQAWPAGSAAPGLLAAGGTLDTLSLLRAYQRGIFPWYSSGQPILWWSPDPRMVLHTAEFRLHRSLRKAVSRFRADPRCEIRFDHDFSTVVQACSATPRDGQSGTWIVPEMVAAYAALHRAGYAHSVETWIDGTLAGGLYCVGVGRAVFGESMFSHRTDASKIALAALVAFARAHAITVIDCQQNTTHLASLGAREIRRADFAVHVEQARAQPAPAWHFDPIYWNHLFPAPA